LINAVSFIAIIFCSSFGVAKSSTSTKALGKAPPSAHQNSRNPASVESSSEVVCEDLSKLATKCSQALDSYFDGRAEQHKKKIRKYQSEILAKKKIVIETKKECPQSILADRCFTQAAEVWSRHGTRNPNLRTEHRDELLSVGNEMLLKLGSQSGRSPAGNN
jgi:hypothetical protein